MADNGRGNTIRDEHRLVCKDGNVKWISLKAQLMPGDDGILYFHGVFVDITDEKLAQRQIRELYEKNWPTLRRQLPRRAVFRAVSTSRRTESRATSPRTPLPSLGRDTPMNRRLENWQILQQTLSMADTSALYLKGTCVVRFCRRKNRSSF